MMGIKSYVFWHEKSIAEVCFDVGCSLRVMRPRPYPGIGKCWRNIFIINMARWVSKVMFFGTRNRLPRFILLLDASFVRKDHAHAQTWEISGKTQEQVETDVKNNACESPRKMIGIALTQNALFLLIPDPVCYKDSAIEDITFNTYYTKAWQI